MVVNGGDVAESAKHSNRHHLPLRMVVAVGIGNALEFYDFLTFSFFAIQIGHTFFPKSQTSHGLLFSLATFGVGFITRPLGAIVIGTYGDRAGRKPAMMLSFTLMGVAILGLALTPSFAEIGLAAPVLLLGFRLLQGFALGGEVGPSTAFLIEVAPPYRRGFYVSIQSATQGLAVLIAGLVGFILSSLLSSASLDAWGWRIAFLLGAAVVPVGLHIRRHLPETLHNSDHSKATSTRPRVPLRLVMLGLMMLAAMTITSYVLGYMTTYAQDTLKLATNLAFGAAAISGLCRLGVAPLSGLLSDRIGRQPVMLCAVAMLLVLVVPSYIIMNHLRSVTALYGVTAVLSVIAVFADVSVLVTITETLPKAVRSGALATIYAVAIATFGGSAQFVIKRLIDATHSPLAPAWYLTGALVIGGFAMLRVRESAPCKNASDALPAERGSHVAVPPMRGRGS